MSKLTSKYLLITTVVIAFIIIVFGIFGFIILNKAKEAETPNFIDGEIINQNIEIIVQDPITKDVKTYDHVAQKGESLLVFMRSLQDQNVGFKFDYSESEYGTLVTGINGYEANSDQGEFWKFFINNISSEQSVSEFMVTGGDVIRWEIDHF